MTLTKFTGTTALTLAVLATFPAFADPVEEIVVTTTQRPSPLKDLAGNLAIIDDVAFVAPDHPADLLNRLPGVNIQHGSGQEHLTSIRSPVLTGGAGAGSFLYLEDGISLRSPGFANVNGLFEAHIEQAGRIEVVRGPGSALYGSNAVHGMVNVMTMDPDDLDAMKIDLAFGSHEQSMAKLMVPFIGDVRSGVLNVTLKQDNGYRADTGYEQQKVTMRSDWSEGPDNVTLMMSFNNLSQETGGYVLGTDSYKDDRLAASNPNPEAYREAKSLRGYLRWDRQLSDTTALSITPYFRKTEMDFLMHFLPGDALETNGHKSFGVQSRVYKNTGGGHLIVAGIDTEYTEGFLQEVQDAPTLFGVFVQGTHYDYVVKAAYASPYVHTEWAISDKTRVTAGLRLDYTNYDYENKTQDNTVGRFQRAPDRSDDFTTLTPKLGVTHQLSEDLTLFGLYARGQRAPQTTDLYRIQSQQTPGDVDPEIVDSIEVGLRGYQGPVQFELTAYAMKKKNFFFRDSNGLNFTDGKTQHIGVELGFAADLIETVDLSGSLTYAKHTYAFDKTDSSENIRDGNDIDTAPAFLANVRLGWEPLEGLRAELEWVHMDEYFTDAGNLHSYDGHDLFHLRASYRVSALLTVTGRIQNIADTAYADRADFSRGQDRYFTGDKRFFSIGLSVTL